MFNQKTHTHTQNTTRGSLSPTKRLSYQLPQVQQPYNRGHGPRDTTRVRRRATSHHTALSWAELGGYEKKYPSEATQGYKTVRRNLSPTGQPHRSVPQNRVIQDPLPLSLPATRRVGRDWHQIRWRKYAGNQVYIKARRGPRNETRACI